MLTELSARTTKSVKYAGAGLLDALLSLAARRGMIRPRPAELPGCVSKVLMLSLDNLGDAILATPAVEALKTCLPETTLTLLCRPSSAPVFEFNPHVDRIITDDAPWWSSSPVRGSLRPRYWRNYATTVSFLRGERYDAIVDLRGDLRHLLLFGLLARPKILLGHERTGGGALLTVRLAYDEGMPEVEKKLALLKPLGVAEVRPAPRIWVRPEETQWAQQLILSAGVKPPVVIVDPGAKPVQQWPVERFAYVARRLRDETGSRALISAGPQYQDLARRLAGLVDTSIARLVLGLSVRQVIAVTSAADLVISSDTGLGHVATAVGTPVVTLFGPTDPARFWCPRDASEIVRAQMKCCLATLHDTCSLARRGQPGRCMIAIEPDEVLAAALRVLGCAAGKRVTAGKAAG